MKRLTYNIAEYSFSIEGEELLELISQTEAFLPFETSGEGEVGFSMRYSTEETLPMERNVIFEGQSDVMFLSFFKLSQEGEYWIDLTTIEGQHSYLLTNMHERVLRIGGELSAWHVSYLLRLGYGIMTARTGRIAIHSSCVVFEDKAYLFLGESGTGKSTHTHLWEAHIPNTKLLNDDSPVLFVKGDKVMVCGSPWSGKSSCYRAEKYPLGGVVRLQQATYNRITPLEEVIQKYAIIHPSCPPEFAQDKMLYEGISRTLGEVIPKIPFFRLECLPNREAVLLSFNTLCRK